MLNVLLTNHSWYEQTTACCSCLLFVVLVFLVGACPECGQQFQRVYGAEHLVCQGHNLVELTAALLVAVEGLHASEEQGHMLGAACPQLFEELRRGLALELRDPGNLEVPEGLLELKLGRLLLRAGHLGGGRALLGQLPDVVC
uniref:Putative secreted protein n=1 Tax=Ixodes ricinus TaxID=34613 RepID=A0A6B0UU42_IXORI